MNQLEQDKYNVLLAEKKTLWDNWRKDQSLIRNLRRKIRGMQEELDRLRSDQDELMVLKEYDGW